MVEYSELLLKRRSIRDYEDREVPVELIREILKECTLAPSSSNSQPWNFIIINARALIKRISDESKKNILADIHKSENSPGKRYEQVLKMEQFNVFYNAPCLMIVCGPASHLSLQVDIALFASYFMFGAAARGLGTCWVNLGAYIKDPALKAEIGLPEDFAVVAPIIVGYPRIIPTASPREEPRILKILP
jgi:nitroreductase